MRLLFLGLLTGLWGCESAKDDVRGSQSPTDTATDREADVDTDTDTDIDTGSAEPCIDFEMAIVDGETLLPSVVRIAFKLTCEGDPVSGKTDEDFTVYEDGDVISRFESSQQIVPTVAGFQLSTLLMLDMSGSMVESGNLPDLQTAATAFIATMGGGQEVAIYTFDGQDDPSLLVSFTTDSGVLTAAVDGLDTYEVVDTSTNLNGAVLKGLNILDAEAATHTDKLFAGTLALFTDGKDQAGRIGDERAVEGVSATEHAVYSIGLGGEIDESHLARIGKDGSFFATAVDDLLSAFDQVAADILAEANSLYILAYCSPKRAGAHTLQLKLEDNDASLAFDFDAAGFEGGCEPTDFVPPEFLDVDGDGFRPYDGDCDDNNGAVYPGAEERCDGVDNDCDDAVDEEAVDAPTWYADGDGDGYGDVLTTWAVCEVPEGYVDDATDCDDAEPASNPGLAEMPYDGIDNDCDGTTPDDDLDEDGFVLADDCDDGDATVNADAVEVCDEIDNDCSGAIDDEAIDALTWYADGDEDGFGDPDDETLSCGLPEGFLADATDCDDGRDDTYPGHAELPYDGADNDCDPATPDDDLDGDGYLIASDCDDDEFAAHPGGVEVCDEIDNDCDGVVDDGVTIRSHRDADGDGFGDADAAVDNCAIEGGFVADASDCDDDAYAVNPGAAEYCDDIDNDCDASVDEGAADATVFFADADGDGYGDSESTLAACELPTGYVDEATDCDDEHAEVNPGHAEVPYDGLDNDCETLTPDDDLDADGYGISTDCDDGRADVSPALTEVVYDGLDNDCDGTTRDDDLDEDGYDLADDCDDVDSAAHPGATEFCDDVDNDCDGVVDEDGADGDTFYADGDSDGFGDADTTTRACSASSGFVTDATDCDDTRDSVYPGAAEVCDGLDNDCDTSVDEEVLITSYRDADSDGYGDAEISVQSCEVFAGYVTDATDCDDESFAVSPGAMEFCDGVDNDCDGVVDEIEGTYTYYRDADEDGFGQTDATAVVSACSPPSGFAAVGGDCDDLADTVYPGAPEYCDGVDNNCSGVVDDYEGEIPYELAGASMWYADLDGDTYGDGLSALADCDAPTGYIADDTDCDDDDAAVNPDAVEDCNGFDDDCDGLIDEDGVETATYYLDEDGDGYGVAGDTVVACSLPDGYAEVAGDCDDSNPDLADGLGTEMCPGVDCQAIFEAGASSGDGDYWVDPERDGAGIEVFCEMSTDGGGWTLVAVSSDDGLNNWNWDNRHYWDTDETVFGSLDTLNQDYKSPALHSVGMGDMLFIHAPSGVWGSYQAISDIGASLASFIAEVDGPVCYFDGDGGYPMSAGTLEATVRWSDRPADVGTNRLCTTELFFNAKDMDGSSDCTSGSTSQDGYGPVWSVREPSGASPHQCPLDEVGQSSSLGPNSANTGTEYNPIGYGLGMVLNTGSSGSGANNMRVFVRRGDVVAPIGGGDTGAPADTGTWDLPGSLCQAHYDDGVFADATRTLTGDDGSSFSAFCHMSSHGGGWTNVYLSDSNDHDSTTLDYDIPIERWAGVSEVLIGYANTSYTGLTDTAVFDIPADWLVQAPMRFGGESMTVSARINDGATVPPVTLVYGFSNFGDGCPGAFHGLSSRYGKIGVCGTAGPYWNAWADGGVDRCAYGGDGAVGAAYCTTARRFSIWVR